jgi:hypothetical protein
LIPMVVKQGEGKLKAMKNLEVVRKTQEA